MADNISKLRRSENMRRIRAKDTKAELVVRKLLHRNGFRYVLHDRRLPGTPDIVLPRLKAAIQIRGCFWHGHTCLDGHIPKSRNKYWVPKLLGNKARDKRNDRRLRRLGWRLLIVWECKTDQSRLSDLTDRLSSFVNRSLR